ncbi:MAG: Trk system potassium transporter TrkA [Deltaproteobacteria bacterium]
MKIIIIGGGEVGAFLARGLSKENDVIVIEKDKDLAKRIGDTYDVLSIDGDGKDPEILKKYSVDADVSVSVTGNDETNILSCLLFSSFGIPTVIARVGNPEFLDYPEHLNKENIFIVNPGTIISKRIFSIIGSPFAWRVEKFAQGKIRMFKLKIEEDTPIAGRKLSQLGGAENWQFVALSRNGTIHIPKGETELQVGDYIYALGNPEKQGRLKELLGLEEEELETVIIMGGGKIGTKAASNLAEQGLSVRLLESDSDRARSVAEDFPDILVLNGDGTESDALKEAGITSADYFLSLTGDDEKNALSALLAKSMGAKRVLILYNKSDYMNLIEKIGIDRALSEKVETANEILKILRIGTVEKISLVAEGNAQVLEFEITDKAKILDTPLKDAKLPEESIVGVVIRGDDLILPRGDFRASAGDTIVIFALPEAVEQLENMLV